LLFSVFCGLFVATAIIFKFKFTMIVNFWAVTLGFTPVYVKNEFIQIPSTPVTPSITRTTSLRSSVVHQKTPASIILEWLREPGRNTIHI
jgi:hypothetical protein